MTSIVAAESEVEHDTIMRKLLQQAREANGKFNAAKLQFKVSEVKYMGNIVSESGLKPDDEKIRAILEMPVPESKDELQRPSGNGKLLRPVYSKPIDNKSTPPTAVKEGCRLDVVA